MKKWEQLTSHLLAHRTDHNPSGKSRSPSGGPGLASPRLNLEGRPGRVLDQTGLPRQGGAMSTECVGMAGTMGMMEVPRFESHGLQLHPRTQ